MITLLIVSLALAAAAPIMSKKMVSDNSRQEALQKNFLCVPDYAAMGTDILELDKELTAKQDGWLIIRIRSNTYANRLYINGSQVFYFATSVAAYTGGMFYVKKGDVYKIVSTDVWFIPCRT